MVVNEVSRLFTSSLHLKRVCFDRFQNQFPETMASPSVRRLIVGLGNIGSEFHRTRHNVGFAVCRLFVSEYLPKMESEGQPINWKLNKSCKASLLQNSVSFTQESALGLDMADSVSERAMEKTKTSGVPFPNVKLSMMLPTTYMNNSGQAVVLFTKRNHFRLKNPGSKNMMDEFIVVHDDISIPFGEIRFTPKVGIAILLR